MMLMTKTYPSPWGEGPQSGDEGTQTTKGCAFELSRYYLPSSAALRHLLLKEKGI